MHRFLDSVRLNVFVLTKPPNWGTFHYTPTPPGSNIEFSVHANYENPIF